MQVRRELRRGSIAGAVADGKLIDGAGFVGLAGPEDGVGKPGSVGAVREVLGFQAEGASLGVGAAGFSGQRAVEEVRGVELDSGFLSEDLHDAAAGFF